MLFRSEELGARYIIAFTDSGMTARLVSHFRPRCPILAMTPSKMICRRLALPWGITPILSINHDSLEEMLEHGLNGIKYLGLTEPGDIAVVLFGTSLIRGTTNVMNVHTFD